MASAQLLPRAEPRDRVIRRALLLVVAVALAYANSLDAPFLFDDAGAVIDNPTIRRFGSFEALRPPVDGSTTTGRPLVNLSFALNYALSGEQVWSYHAGNVAIHAAAALLLYGLVRRTLQTLSLAVPPGAERVAARQLSPLSGSNAALLVALIWAMHPLQTESVVCIAQRTETLCGFFYLLTLYAFVRGTHCHPLDDNHHVRAHAAGLVCRLVDDNRRRWLTISVVSCLLGMAAKEVMVTAPVVVLLFDRTFVAGTFSAAWRARRGYYGVLAATWFLLAGLVLQSGG